MIRKEERATTIRISRISRRLRQPCLGDERNLIDLSHHTTVSPTAALSGRLTSDGHGDGPDKPGKPGNIRSMIDAPYPRDRYRPDRGGASSRRLRTSSVARLDDRCTS